jgi:hypothetical protein
VSAIEIVLAVLLIAISWLVMVWQFGALRWWEPRLLIGYYYIHVAAHLIPSIVFMQDLNRPGRYRYFWGCVITALLIPLGGLLGRLVMPLRERAITAYFRAPVDSSPRALRASRLFILGLGAVAVILLVTYVQKVPNYPLREMLLEEVTGDDLKSSRRESLNEETGYVYTVARAFLMPSLFVSVLALWRFERRRLVKLLYVVFLVVVLGYNSYTSAKTPVVVLFVLGFCLFFQRRLIPTPVKAAAATRRPRRRMLAWGALAVTLLAGVAYPVFIFQYKSAGQKLTLGELLVQGILFRVVLKPAENSYTAFEMFPKYRDYTYFADIGRLAAVFGIEHVNLSQLTSSYKEGRPTKIAVGSTVVTNAPPTTVGTFYAQGGWLAVILGTMLAAMVLQVMQGLFVAHGAKLPLHQAQYAVLMFATLRLSMGHFHSILLSEAIVPVTVCFITYEMLRRLRVMPLAVRPPAVAR